MVLGLISFHLVPVALAKLHYILAFGGGGGSSSPTLQQQQLETEQALTTANLNLQENAQRKAILNSMMGTRVFRGSALSRSLIGNDPGGNATPTGPASNAQTSSGQRPARANQQSLLDQRQSDATGATTSGGAGASATPSIAGGYRGGFGPRGIVGR